MKTCLLLLFSCGAACLADSKTEADLRRQLTASEVTRSSLVQQMAQLRAASLQLQTTNTILTNILQRQSKQLVDEMARLKQPAKSAAPEIAKLGEAVQRNTDATTDAAGTNDEILKEIKAALKENKENKAVSSHRQTTFLTMSNISSGAVLCFLFIGFSAILLSIRRLRIVR
jgi:hypothetical protein